MRISDWSSDVCSSDLFEFRVVRFDHAACAGVAVQGDFQRADHEPSRARQGEEEFGHALVAPGAQPGFVEEVVIRSEEHTSELQSLMRISYAVICLKKTNITEHPHPTMSKLIAQIEKTIN